MLVNLICEYHSYKETKAGNYLVKVISEDGELLQFFLENCRDFTHLEKYSPLEVKLNIYRGKDGNLKYMLDSYHIFEDGEYNEV